jgi:hypothetical protein
MSNDIYRMGVVGGIKDKKLARMIAAKLLQQFVLDVEEADVAEGVEIVKEMVDNLPTKREQQLMRESIVEHLQSLKQAEATA